MHGRVRLSSGGGLEVKRQIIAALIVLAAFFVAVDVYVSHFFFREQAASLEKQLTIQAQMLAAELPTDASIRDVAARAQASISIFDRNGTVLANSGQASQSADQPEIRAALNGKVASAIRKDVASGEEFINIAAPASNSPAAAISLATSLEPARARSAALFYRLIAICLIALALVAGFAYWFVKSFSRRAAQLETYADHLLDPHVSAQDLSVENDALGALAQSLQRTAVRFGKLVETMELEGTRRETILASMLEGVLAVNKDLRVTFCNDSFARAVGARIPVTPGIALLELVRDPALIDILTQALATGGRVERRITLLSAADHSFEVLAGPLAGSPQPGALAILHDVTQLERLERVRKDFVANVSHELRTPLAAIRGYAETLLDGAIDDRENNRKFLEIIMRQATGLTNIAADLLTLSELESNVGAGQPRPISVSTVLESALRTVEPSAQARGITLISGRIEDLKVRGRELRLEQVFVNLLDNAIKFSRPNGEVVIEAQSVDGNARITIADSGIGIPSEDLPRIFERFYRVDKARSRDVGGTGLGLSIVKHVIEQMAGTVTVDSRIGQGSRFTVTVPCVR
jgi:two-component system phosphate regulon sensor histidine kinase PhoR